MISACSFHTANTWSHPGESRFQFAGRQAATRHLRMKTWANGHRAATSTLVVRTASLFQRQALAWNIVLSPSPDQQCHSQLPRRGQNSGRELCLSQSPQVCALYAVIRGSPATQETHVHPGRLDVQAQTQASLYRSVMTLKLKTLQSLQPIIPQMYRGQMQAGHILCCLSRQQLPEGIIFSAMKRLLDDTQRIHFACKKCPCDNNMLMLRSLCSAIVHVRTHHGIHWLATDQTARSACTALSKYALSTIASARFGANLASKSNQHSCHFTQKHSKSP